MTTQGVTTCPSIEHRTIEVHIIVNWYNSNPALDVKQARLRVASGRDYVVGLQKVTKVRVCY